MKTEPQIPPRWYMVNRYGGATLCIDEADALHECKKADMEYATHAPHVAVQLAPARTLDAAPSEPSAEHWRRAISDWNWDHPRDPDAAYLKRIEQRARELSQESRRDG